MNEWSYLFYDIAVDILNASISFFPSLIRLLLSVNRPPRTVPSWKRLLQRAGSSARAIWNGFIIVRRVSIRSASNGPDYPIYMMDLTYLTSYARNKTGRITKESLHIGDPTTSTNTINQGCMRDFSKWRVRVHTHKINLIRWVDCPQRCWEKASRAKRTTPLFGLIQQASL